VTAATAATATAATAATAATEATAATQQQDNSNTTATTARTATATRNHIHNHKDNNHNENNHNENDIYIYTHIHNSSNRNTNQQSTSKTDSKIKVQASTFHVGPHIVVGRNKIRSRPKELYERLFAYARGDDYPGSDLSVDEDGKAFGNGHIAAGDFSLEIWWNLIFNQNQSWQHPDDPKGLRCKLGWCHDKQC